MDEATLARDVQGLKEELRVRPEPVARPVLVVVGGLPGTGKSHFSRCLARELPCIIVESDDLRKRLFGTPSYTAGESQHLFQVLHRLVEEFLKDGISVIVDATNLVEHHRERLYYIADRLGLKLIVVRVEAPVEVVRQRLEGRLTGADPQDRSEADWEVYQRMRPRMERIRRNHFAVDTSRDINPVVQKILREARR